MAAKLFRVTIPVSDIERATSFYGRLLHNPGKRISPARHDFNCGGTILACYDPRADGKDEDSQPNPDHVYFAVPDLENHYARARTGGCKFIEPKIETRAWGERSFYAKDPFGNPLCFVDETTVVTG